MLDAQTIGLLTLIRSALTGQSYDLPQGFELDGAAKIANRQGVSAMLYYGAVNCGVDKRDPVMKSLFAATCAAISRGECQNKELQAILDAFAREGIDHMPLKGPVLKRMYPKSEMRTMGDVDILIRLEQYHRIRPIMQALGFSEINENDHELNWQKRMKVELHKRLIPSHDKDFYEYFGDGWSLAHQSKDVSCCYTMSVEDQMVYLFTHMAKHYRNKGIGLKHLTDLYVFRKHHTQLNELDVCKALRKLHLEQFYHNVLHLLDSWFLGEEFSEKSEFIMRNVLSGGAYGTSRNGALAAAVKASKTTGSTRTGREKRIISAIFPSVDTLKYQYPWVKTNPLLLVVAWFLRGLEIVFCRPQRLKSFADEMNMMRVEDVENYQQALLYVGLDYHYKE